MRRISILLPILLFYSGCADPRQEALQQAQMRENITAGEDSTCRSYGLKYGTSEYATCRQNLALQRNQQDFVDAQIGRQMAYQYMMRRY
jgi:hypothetical protein